MTIKLTIHLASGGKVVTLVEDADVTDEFEYLERLEEDLRGDARPGWRQIEDVLVFSQAVSAVQAEGLDT